ncbi:MAG: hypothetical protein ACLTFB_02620 [Candidatus Phytoplasma pyri]|uniref:hypothetical protein n=1 Tax=Candidatus Phytoplasma pyri TaxID=47566 RepID=UPI0039839D9F
MLPNKYIYELNEILTVLKTTPQFKVLCSNKVKTNYNTELKYLFLNFNDLAKIKTILTAEPGAAFMIEIQTDLNQNYFFDSEHKKLIVKNLPKTNFNSNSFESLAARLTKHVLQDM